MNKNILWIVVALIMLAGLFVMVRDQEPGQDAITISSFDECVSAGYPIMESYPAQCATPDGRTFIQPIDEPVVESQGNIHGIVLIGPTCPGPVRVDRPDGQCGDKPYAGDFALATADGSDIVKEFSSDSNGKFTIDVLPGEYAIRAAGANILPQCAANGPIIVKANGSTEVMVNCDSGIR